MNKLTAHDHDEQDDDKQVDQSGSEGNDAPAAPFDPDADDKSPLGDTDEHSDA